MTLGFTRLRCLFSDRLLVSPTAPASRGKIKIHRLIARLRRFGENEGLRQCLRDHAIGTGLGQ